MARSDAQRRASAKYRKQSVKRYDLSSYPADSDIYEWFASKLNEAGYLKDLIHADMENRSR